MSIQTKKPGRVKAAILNWLGVPLELTSNEFWQAWASSTNAAGQKVNENTVMSLSAAWACTRLVSEAVATLPLHLYERTPDGRQRAVNHPLYGILNRSPNAESTPATFWEAKTAAILLRGNGFSEKQWFNGRLVGLRFLSPGRLGGTKLANGDIQLRYTEDDGTQRPVRERDLFHIPGFSLDGKWGLSTIQYGASVFGSALAAANAANGTFERGLAPTVAFTMEKVLKKEQRDEFRENLKDISGALHAGESPLLEGGMDAKNIGIKPSDAQLLESRSFSVEEVCRWFRVDPSMVGHGNKDSNWGTGLEQKLISFLTFTLRPWLTRIEQAINKNLLSPQDQRRFYAEFSIEGLLRADSAARASFYSVMVDHGIMTRDEVRQLENLPTRGGNADVLTVQTAMAPLDSLGQANDGDTARAALAAWLNQGQPSQQSNTDQD
ncbi:phage portal protein [Aidingimonas halophila]|uniref:Phage portal protein, HK97 family n=1 Tax=Aidingimonas halophila TaxID=574349 RepID=A0A1H2RFE6_9GAMM|nr:phage portal protein [Aidingimonas halophila]GHC19408.1 phage portal protein [Aidingimonas halophila]SDW17544.1 phage portal protein, HK97 family [Aidingimonas halophila]